MERHTKRRGKAGYVVPVVSSERNLRRRVRAADSPWQLALHGLDSKSGAASTHGIGREDADG